MSEQHRTELTRAAEITIEAIQNAKKFGYEQGYKDGMTHTYEDVNDVIQDYFNALKEDEPEEKFWPTFLWTIGIGLIAIGLWWIVSGQLAPLHTWTLWK